MATNRTCARCGAQLTPSSVEGLCPRCMLASAFEEPPPLIRVQGSPATEVITHDNSPAFGATPGLKLRYFGDYELLEEIGRGGMGIVYRARQVSLNRFVAVKMLLHGEFSDPAFIQRFQTEAEAAAQLDHPNIVPIHEIGAHQGQHYFSMRLIEGCTLADLITRNDRSVTKIELPPAGRQDQEVCASLIVTVARAVHFAHQHGVLHRDIKPQNILLDAEGEPHLTDFGLAKLLENDSGLTVSHSVVGSPSFMAPEQAAGHSRQLTTAADVYSLGAVLYALLTGVPPFQGSSALEVLRQVLDGEPPRPSALNSGVDRDLETICLKCLEKDATRRYGSAEALANDLECWLRHEPILARPVSLLASTRKWVQRKPLVAALAASVAVLVGIVTIGSLITSQRATRKGEILRRHLYVAETKLAQQALARVHVHYARTLLNQQRPKPDQEDFRGFEWRYLWGLTDGGLVTLDQGPPDVEYGLAFSPDGKLLAGSGQSNTVLVWDLHHRSLSATLGPHSDVITSVAFSSDGRSLAAGLGHWKVPAEAVKLWDLKTQSAVTLRLPGTEGSTRSVAFSPDGQLIAIGSNDPDVRLWNPKANELISLHGHSQGWVTCVAFSPDGTTLASASDDNTARLWDLETKQTRAVLKGHEDVLWGVAFSHDGHALVTTSRDFTVALWNTATGELISRSYPGPKEPPKTKAVFSRDDSKIGVADATGTVRVFEAGSWSNPRLLLGHTAGVWDLTFSPTEDLLATASCDGSVKLWNTFSTPNPKVLEFKDAGVARLRFSPPDGQTLALGFENGAVQFQDLAGRARPFEIQCDGGLVTSPSFLAFRRDFFAFSPDGKRVAVIRSTNTVEIWDLATKTRMRLISVEQGDLYCIAYSPDGQRLATGSKGETAILWDMATGQSVHTLSGHQGRVLSLAFSGSGKLLATGADDGIVRLWNVESGRLVSSNELHNGVVLALTFSPDDSTLAATGFGAKLILSDVASKRRRVLTAHQAPLDTVAFSRDGKTIATSDWRDMTRLWHVATGQEIAEFDGSVVAFSPDDRVLAIGQNIPLPDSSNGTRTSSRVSLHRAPLLEEIAARETYLTGEKP